MALVAEFKGTYYMFCNIPGPSRGGEIIAHPLTVIRGYSASYDHVTHHCLDTAKRTRPGRDPTSRHPSTEATRERKVLTEAKRTENEPKSEENELGSPCFVTFHLALMLVT